LYNNAATSKRGGGFFYPLRRSPTTVREPRIERAKELGTKSGNAIALKKTTGCKID
jgi:hypothetical protein